ncbi:aconitase family protein [Aspergillus luchuensis]|uniref:Aconitase family protein n=1 Tax=Aspergillus kawachii TaxID=1069201 RepID=A0A146F6Y9_ASPKA|nr:aconitase family protein [Aspergillus luchuensis]
MGDASEPRSPSLLQVLQQTRNVILSETDIDALRAQDHPREANALTDVLAISQQPTEIGGLGLSAADSLTPEQEAEITFLVTAWLEALNSADRARAPPVPLAVRPPGRRGMTLSEKIFALHDIDRKGSVAPGELIRVDVDWVIASEASWQGMERTYERLGKPGIYRNDRFWLAGDHVVDPRVNENPKVKALIDASERAKRVFKMTDYQGMNYTILHTEFYRERAQPGMVVVGSDSHTCSSGALGCLAIGLGAADVTLPLVTGETWFKVPESVNIRLVGAPKPGIGGKDTILYILQQLKRNTVAADRIVEFTGPGVKHLSCDARFAISNMTTEFGGITGVFVPDQITEEFIQKRRLPRHKNTSVYFKPDDDAEYAETHEIDLGEVRSFLAKYPNPDDVVPVTEQEGMHLDGCFIGACTTAEEDLILGALVLEQGFQRGMKPVSQGKRKVVPGSVPILHRLREVGLAQIYEDAGFEIGIPGCSYCVGMSADQAGPGEVWISSQNRNFENRMGKDVKSSEVDTSETADSSSSDVMTGKVQRLGDFIDTDALAPAQFLIGMSDNKIAGEHCLEHTHPEFRQRVKDGFNIVVAGKAFGCGSSREQAVMALLGCGVQCVIAKSYSFIFQRNMPSLGLLGITLTDEAFYDVAEDGNEISIDFKTKVIDVDGKQFRFQLSQMERELFQHGGIASAFQKFGNRLFEQMTRPKNLGSAKSLALHGSGESAGPHAGLQW